MSLEEFLSSELGTRELRPLGAAGGGCISEGRSYQTDSEAVFVKHNTKSEVIPREGRGSAGTHTHTHTKG